MFWSGLATENKSLASLCGADIFQPNLTYESLGRVLTLELVTDHMGSPRKGFVARVRGNVICLLAEASVAYLFV